jgi:hypothetical protein
MIDDKQFEVVAVMCDLIKTVTEANKQGLVDRVTAEQHVSMYLREVSDIMNPVKAKATMI